MTAFAISHFSDAHVLQETACAQVHSAQLPPDSSCLVISISTSESLQPAKRKY